MALTQVSSIAMSFGYSMNTYIGVMQQPASHFYHAVYGLNSQVSLFKSMQVRLGGFERPKFESEGYVDREYGVYILLGGVVAKDKRHEMRAYVGSGNNKGFINEVNSDSRSSRSYSINGVLFSMEYSLGIKNYEVNFAHSQFVGSNNREHLEAFVAWPFSFFSVGIGYRWE